MNTKACRAACMFVRSADILMRGMMLSSAGVLAFPFARRQDCALPLHLEACTACRQWRHASVFRSRHGTVAARALRRSFHLEDLLLPLTLSLFGALCDESAAMLDSWIVVSGRTPGLPVLGGVLYAGAGLYAACFCGRRSARRAHAASISQLLFGGSVLIFCAFSSSFTTLLLSLDAAYTEHSLRVRRGFLPEACFRSFAGGRSDAAMCCSGCRAVCAGYG